MIGARRHPSLRATTASSVVLLLFALTAQAGPGRHLRYAESDDRLVFAFVFGSKDTCRVIRRPSPPRFKLDRVPRGYGAAYRGVSGEKLLAEFDFGRDGRPVHLLPTNEGKHLLAFANRAPDGGWAEQDRIFFLDGTGYKENISYEDMPRDKRPTWPGIGRALAAPKAVERKPPPLSYAFLTKQSSPSRMLIARHSEDDTFATEMVCFVVTIPDGEAKLPEQSELTALLGHTEPLFRAGAAWALGKLGKPAYAAAIKAALTRTTDGASRVVIATALVRCGASDARKTLRAVLTEEKSPGPRRAAALALARLKPHGSDANALATAVADGDAETAELAGIALARLGEKAVPALVRVSRSSKPGTRAAVATTLGRLDTDAAEKRLLGLARDTDPVVQLAAAVALTNPPRAILPEHHGEFARALMACRRNQKASRRLSILAAHAKIHHEKVLKALVDLSGMQPKAIWSLNKLMRKEFMTAKDCKTWWKGRDR